jgi:hypothetical protein
MGHLGAAVAPVRPPGTVVASRRETFISARPRAPSASHTLDRRNKRRGR